VLVQMVMSDEAWYVVRNTPGVTGFVGSHGAGSKPSPLLPEEVDSVFRSMGMNPRKVEIQLSLENMSKLSVVHLLEWKASLKVLMKIKGKLLFLLKCSVERQIRN